MAGALLLSLPCPLDTQASAGCLGRRLRGLPRPTPKGSFGGLPFAILYWLSASVVLVNAPHYPHHSSLVLITASQATAGYNLDDVQPRLRRQIRQRRITYETPGFNCP